MTPTAALCALREKRRLRARSILALVAMFASLVTHAEVRATTAPPGAGATSPVSASVSLDFTAVIGEILFFRLGAPGSTVETITFDLNILLPPQCKKEPLPICFGNGIPVRATANGTLPVEIKANRSAVQITASVGQPLTDGRSVIPLSQILISSSDPLNFPAPVVPNGGTGIAVTGVTTSFAGQVTERSATWTFAYANTVSPSAGAYTGQIVFTVSSP